MDEVTWALAELGLAPGADSAAVKRAFRRLALERHPDRGGDRDAFEELVAAAELLRDLAPEPVEVAPTPPPTAAPRRSANPYATFLVELDEADRSDPAPPPPSTRRSGGPTAEHEAADRAARFAEALASAMAAA